MLQYEAPENTPVALGVAGASDVAEVSYALLYRRGTIEIYDRSEDRFPVVLFRRASGSQAWMCRSRREGQLHRTTTE